MKIKIKTGIRKIKIKPIALTPINIKLSNEVYPVDKNLNKNSERKLS